MRLTNAILRAGPHAAMLADCVSRRGVAHAMKMVAADLRRSPRDAAAWCTLGALYWLEGMWERSADAFFKAFRLDPQHWPAHVGLGCVRLTQGRYPDGWRGYQARWRLPNWHEKMLYPAESMWDGVPRPRASVLLWCGDDLGAAILFARYVPWLASLGLDVRLQPPQALASLFTMQWPELIHPEDRHYYDSHLPLSDLLVVWQGEPPGTLAHSGPYLSVGAIAGASGTLPVVGVACARGDASISSSLRREQWLAMRAAKLVEWVDLDPIVAVSGQEDLLPLARRIVGLDLVITSDSTVAHLAGALGRPTWLVLGPVPEPVWLLEREDSPWYRSVRLFRHAAGADSARVLGRVVQAIAEWIAEGSAVPELSEVLLA